MWTLAPVKLIIGPDLDLNGKIWVGLKDKHLCLFISLLIAFRSVFSSVIILQRMKHWFYSNPILSFLLKNVSATVWKSFFSTWDALGHNIHCVLLYMRCSLYILTHSLTHCKYFSSLTGIISTEFISNWLIIGVCMYFLVDIT